MLGFSDSNSREALEIFRRNLRNKNQEPRAIKAEGDGKFKDLTLWAQTIARQERRILIRFVNPTIELIHPSIRSPLCTLSNSFHESRTVSMSKSLPISSAASVNSPIAIEGFSLVPAV